MALCAITVPPALVGPVTLLWGIASIFLLSFLANRATRATIHLPRWIHAPFLAPAIAWHELCHASVCLLVGHRIEEIRLRADPRTGEPPHVTYRFDPNNPLQTLGVGLSGWAPVLVSASLLAWVVPLISSLGVIERGLACYAIVVLALSMPLSLADWRAVLYPFWLIVLCAIPLGIFLYPGGASLCMAWVHLRAAVIPIGLVLMGVWALFTVARGVLR